jgi:hypothetical protein
MGSFRRSRAYFPVRCTGAFTDGLSHNQCSSKVEKEDCESSVAPATLSPRNPASRTDDPMTPSPYRQHKKTVPTDSAPVPLPDQPLRRACPATCPFPRRSRVALVASEYPAMLCRSVVASGGSVAFARPLGTVRTLYTDIGGDVKGVCMVTDSTADPPRLSAELIDAVGSGNAMAAAITAGPALPHAPLAGTARRAVAGWIVFDLGN